MIFEGIRGFFSGKPLKLLVTESFAEVQFVIDSCRFVSQSKYLNSSNNDCDWLIVVCFIREQYMADATFTRLENNVSFENSAELRGEIIGFFIIKNEASTVLCSVLKHPGSGRARKRKCVKLITSTNPLSI